MSIFVNHNLLIHKRIISAIFAFIVMFSITSCQREISGDVYTSSQAGVPAEVLSGFVISKRNIVVQQGENLEDNLMGGAIGGVIGGIGGSTIGDGDGQKLATTGGALAGAFLGSMLEKELRKQQAVEYIVKLENGKKMAIVQGVQPILNPGDAIIYIMPQTGRPRITPDKTIGNL